MSHTKIKTVVCGTTFGQFYLEALSQLSDFEVTGILANGSERSKKCAEHYNLPLFESLDQIPTDTDLACVVLRSAVMGGKGTDLSLELLEKGIHVIQEHPAHQKDIGDCLKLARKKGLKFMIGNLYIHLPAVKRFVAAAKAASAQQSPLYIDLALATQVSFPLVHILMETLPSVRPFKINQVVKENGPFQLVSGEIGKIPFTIRAHNEVNPNDPDNHLHLLHSITVGFPGGSLSLTDTHGPVIWRPRLHIPDNKILGQVTPLTSGELSTSSSIFLGPSSAPSYFDILTKQWTRAIGEDLKCMTSFIREEQAIENRAQQELLCSRHWQVLTDALGFPNLKPDAVLKPLDISLLKENVLKIPIGKEENFNLLKRVDENNVYAYSELAERDIESVDAKQIIDYVREMEKAAMTSMIHSLQKQGAFKNVKQAYSKAEVLEDSKSNVRHYPLLTRWLAVMAKRGFIKTKENGYSVNQLISDTTFETQWDQVRKTWDERIGNELVFNYLKTNAEQLAELMMDKQQAALLLFPEGSMDVANAVYKETITTRYLNQTFADIVSRIAQEKLQENDFDKDHKSAFRIIEIGAGTGATSEVVIPSLKEEYEHLLDLEYTFTDISTYFTGIAKKSFEKYPWVNFAIVDIDQSFVDQGLSCETADVIIAAGVLNNARNTDEVVAQFKSTLKPGGYMLITEAITERLEILISQSFMMTPPDDDRIESDSTFLSQSQWENIFENAGVEKFVSLIPNDHKLAPLGQQLFIVKKPSYVKE